MFLETKLIISKVADFGEAQLKLLQSRIIGSNSLPTQFVRRSSRRSSPAYMTPEIFIKESILKSSGIKKFKHYNEILHHVES